MSATSIEKVLSSNDTGETGGHQAGICVPKDENILSFFPSLDPSVKNPRAVLDVCDEAGREWTFTFIYYNNRFFGGTRNEYRLTSMTAFIREFDLKAGDSVILRRDSARAVFISYRRARHADGVLKLGGNWKVIDGSF